MRFNRYDFEPGHNQFGHNWPKTMTFTMLILFHFRQIRKQVHVFSLKTTKFISGDLFCPSDRSEKNLYHKGNRAMFALLKKIINFLYQLM